MRHAADEGMDGDGAIANNVGSATLHISGHRFMSPRDAQGGVGDNEVMLEMGPSNGILHDQLHRGLKDALGRSKVHTNEVRGKVGLPWFQQVVVRGVHDLGWVVVVRAGLRIPSTFVLWLRKLMIRVVAFRGWGGRYAVYSPLLGQLPVP